MNADPAAAELECRFERIDQPGTLRCPEPQPVLDDLEHALLPRVYACIALSRQQLEDFGLAEVDRDLDARGDDQPRIARRAGARHQVVRDAVGGVTPYGRAAAAAMEPRRPGEEQLQ